MSSQKKIKNLLLLKEKIYLEKKIINQNNNK